MHTMISDYQYHGCFWHGCSKCYKDRDPINNSYKSWNNGGFVCKNYWKKNNNKNTGYTLVEQWECDWTNILESTTYKKI